MRAAGTPAAGRISRWISDPPGSPYITALKSRELASFLKIRYFETVGLESIIYVGIHIGFKILGAIWRRNGWSWYRTFKLCARAQHIAIFARRRPPQLFPGARSGPKIINACKLQALERHLHVSVLLES